MPNTSTDKFTIGGIKIYVYGLAAVIGPQIDEVAVLYIGHGRGGDYKSSEKHAKTILSLYKGQIPLIAVAFDLRNHGGRLVQKSSNKDWEAGNLRHGQDLISVIDGSVDDIELLIKYLSLYLPFASRKFINIVAGTSLGGHVAWRVAAKLGPRAIFAIAPIIGCPTLSQLMLRRVTRQSGTQFITYDSLTEEQQRLYPRALNDSLALVDETVESLSEEIQVYAVCGAVDELVPPFFSENWLQKQAHDSHAMLYVQPSTGHETTPEAISEVSTWLNEILASVN